MAKIQIDFKGGSLAFSEGGPYTARDGTEKVAEPSVKITGVTSWGTMSQAAFSSMIAELVSSKTAMAKLGITVNK